MNFTVFWTKNKKNRYTLHTPVLLYKRGVYGGINRTDVFSWWYHDDETLVVLDLLFLETRYQMAKMPVSLNRKQSCNCQIMNLFIRLRLLCDYVLFVKCF